MINRLTTSYLRYAHGLYNVIIILLFLYQGWLGLKIRRDRVLDRLPAVKIVKKHRRFGPALSILGITGFFSGLIVLYLDIGFFYIFIPHFIAGLIISILIATSYLFSRKIKGIDSFWRTAHFVTGVALISLYFIQALLGIVILF